MRDCLLRIHVGESDRHDGKPLYEAIVHKARELELGGATVLKGSMGYRGHGRLHMARVLRLSEDLPVVIEIVDRRERVDELLPHLDEMIADGMITLEQVEAIRYRDGARLESGGD